MMVRRIPSHANQIPLSIKLKKINKDRTLFQESRSWVRISCSSKASSARITQVWLACTFISPLVYYSVLFLL